VFKAKETWLLALLAVVVYLPVLRGEFVWDDLVLVKRNPLATGEHTILSIWFQGDFTLSTVALWLQWLAWGDHAAGYHVVNVALHALNAVLVWRVLLRLGVSGAWLAAALFAVHPVCVASVAWISELKNTLSLAFLLLSVWCYLESEAETNRARRWYGLAVGLFTLALLSKTSTVMLPVVLLLYACRKGGLPPRRDWLRVTPFLALSLAFGLLTIWFQHHQVIGDTVIANGTWLERGANAGAALWFYLGKALAPVNLCMIYPAWSFAGAAAWLPPVLWLALLTAIWVFRGGTSGRAFLALASFTILLFPVLGFFDMYFLALARVSDHFQYLPLICVMALVAAGLTTYLPPIARNIVGALLIGGLAVLTFQRAKVFATDEGLWRDTLAKNPAAWNAHNNLGCILAERGDLGGALRFFEDSLKLNPGNAQAHINLARALVVQGSFGRAEEHFRKAQKLRPADPEAYTHYGQALAGAGRIPEAIAQLRAAAHLKPSADVHLLLAGLYRATSQPGEAIEQTRAALKAKPDSLEALGNLAWLLATTPNEKLRNGAEAVQLATQACQQTGFKEARLVGALAAAHAENGDFTNAVRRAEEAVSLAQAAGNAQFAGMNQQLLQLYRAGRPFRER
jgi:Flp pilus assembly protein TadD